MQTLAKTFSYGSANVRTVIIDNEPWFIAADVCEVLNIAKTNRAVALLDEDEKGAHTMSTLGGPQELITVNEAGLYSLILRSRKPEAKAFKRWVTHEVLPALRKTGIYIVPDESAAMVGGMEMLNALHVLQNQMAEVLDERNCARQEIAMLPEPLGVLPELTNASYLKGAASVYAKLTGASMGAIWASVYREIELRYSIRIGARKKRAQWKGSTLTFAVENGYADKVYAVLVGMIQRYIGK